jgi:hypothetical protein
MTTHLARWLVIATLVRSDGNLDALVGYEHGSPDLQLPPVLDRVPRSMGATGGVLFGR